MWYSFILKLLPIEGIKLTQNERQTKFWFSSCEPCRSRYNVVWMIVFFKGDKMKQKIKIDELVRSIQDMEATIKTLDRRIKRNTRTVFPNILDQNLENILSATLQRVIGLQNDVLNEEVEIEFEINIK